eukprot:NODE_3343_length_985_cov_104.525641_g3197_i0.p1 GENE.NODE_3343_length_985_cov_104.525641_g3197_i0~~NODE_3343_length_985_cov_104.525641_g3197_i0.p1  ORF type:complete len:306 (+),score=89.09 NODE_3343_length_985_cov_104.525641_g3197_i0:27-920(+)
MPAPAPHLTTMAILVGIIGLLGYEIRTSRAERQEMMGQRHHLEELVKQLNALKTKAAQEEVSQRKKLEGLSEQRQQLEAVVNRLQAPQPSANILTYLVPEMAHQRAYLEDQLEVMEAAVQKTLGHHSDTLQKFSDAVDVMSEETTQLKATYQAGHVHHVWSYLLTNVTRQLNVSVTQPAKLFYTTDGTLLGYRFRLALYWASDPEKDHMGLFFNPKPGPHDAYLQWPMPFGIYVTIGGEGHTMGFEENPGFKEFLKSHAPPTTGLEESWGWPRFISHCTAHALATDDTLAIEVGALL